MLAAGKMVRKLQLRARKVLLLITQKAEHILELAKSGEDI
jgi:hypothetical protein